MGKSATYFLYVSENQSPLAPLQLLLTTTAADGRSPTLHSTFFPFSYLFSISFSSFAFFSVYLLIEIVLYIANTQFLQEIWCDRLVELSIDRSDLVVIFFTSALLSKNYTLF